jgi:hypothetical protein
VGYQSGFLGGQIDYYWLPAATRVGVNGYFGVGWIPPVEARTGAESASAIGYAVGAMGFLGRRHRGFVDANYGAAGLIARGIGTAAEMQRTVYGLTAAGGYEFAAMNGFLVRVSLGVSYALGDLWGEFSRTVPTLNISLGYKIF